MTANFWSTGSKDEVAKSTVLTVFMAKAATEPYRNLVKDFISRESAEQLMKGSMAEMASLSKHDIGVDIAMFVETFVDCINVALLNPATPPPQFWSMNCRDAFNVIRKMAAAHAGGTLAVVLNGLSLSFKITRAELVAHEVAFSVFQIATRNFAYNAALDSRAGAYMGIELSGARGSGSGESVAKTHGSSSLSGGPGEPETPGDERTRSQLRHDEFVRRAAADEIVIGVEPALARRYLMKSSGDHLESGIGERATVERAIVTGAYWLGPLAMVASIPAAVAGFSWWSMIAIPVTLVGWWFYYGRASAGRQRVRSVVAGLGLALMLCYQSPTLTPSLLWLVCIAAAFFFARMTFASASFFVRALVVRNVRAFDILNGTVVFVRNGTGA